MESIVRPLLFIYSKTSWTRSKFNYHSNYSPSSTIIYVIRTLILKRRSAHRFYLDSISKVSLPNQYPTSSSLFKTTDARRSLEDLSKGKGEEEEKEEDSCSTGPAGALQDPFSFWSSKISRGNVGWSREIWRPGFDLKWKWRSAGGENKRCPGVNYEARRGEGEEGGGQRGRQFRESAGKTLFRRWSIFKGVIEQATTIVHRWLIWFCLFFDALWISRLHFSCFSLSRFAFVCWIVIWIFSGKETSSKVSIWLAFCRECVWIKF